MGSSEKRILERALGRGWLKVEQATELARLRHDRRQKTGEVPAVEALAVEKGYLTAERAAELRREESTFSDKQQIDGYMLLERIGSGSMGTVYKAKQLSLDRTVAIKILSPHLAHNPAFVERFRREARSVAKLNHPNVISGIDVGEAEGVHYFVMEYAAGITVKQILDRGGAMDETRVLPIATQVARALEHAHAAGLVHRDVKPDNILLTKDGAAKLCDLGLAKDRPEEGVAMGTPDYVSPEQARGEAQVDIRSDLYSLGATLYHMLTGRPPFEGEGKTVIRKHLEQAPRPVRELEPDVSPGVERIVMRLLEKSPGDRFSTPTELLGALGVLAAANA